MRAETVYKIGGFAAILMAIIFSFMDSAWEPFMAAAWILFVMEIGEKDARG